MEVFPFFGTVCVVGGGDYAECTFPVHSVDGLVF